MIDFKQVLNELTTSIRETSHIVTEEMFLREAKRMTKAGYIFEEKSLEALWEYLDGYQIGLVGTIGSGKTLFFRLLNTIQFRAWEFEKKVQIVSLAKLSTMTSAEVRKELDKFATAEVLIDDIGAEPTNNTFGVKSEILSFVLDYRAEFKHRTHFTTNLTGKEIKERYGDRIIDRFKRFKIFNLESKSMRTPQRNSLLETMRERIIFDN